MGYRYDAYFSYRHHRESDAWHAGVQRKLSYWVAQELGKPPDFFFDRASIEAGSEFEPTLKDALRDSKCLVCFWSPLYFQSPWCKTEWLTFHERGKAIGKPLVLPATIHTGVPFPPEAQSMQCSDFSDYHVTNGEVFFSTARYVDFETLLLKPFARTLARMIREAPVHRQFPIAELPAGEPDRPPRIGRLADA